MKLKNKDILKSVNSLKYLYEKDNIPFSAALAISDNVLLIDKFLNKYFAQKEEIDNKHLTRDSDNNDTQNIEKLSIIYGHEEDYLKEITELNEKIIDINIKKISPKELSNISFSPKFVEGISFMLDK